MTVQFNWIGGARIRKFAEAISDNGKPDYARTAAYLRRYAVGLNPSDTIVRKWAETDNMPIARYVGPITAMLGLPHPGLLWERVETAE